MANFLVGKNSSGKRADVFVAVKLADFSRASLQGLFKQGLIQINGIQSKPSHRLKIGEKVHVDLTPLRKKPPAIKLSIIYEDKDVIVINKPSGVLTHSKGLINLEPTVASFIKPKITEKSMGGNRAGIVHRLDRWTSGVIITARHKKAVKLLQKQFSTRKVGKIYIAIVEGQPEEPAAIIDAPIARNPRKPQTFKVSPLGRPAKTTYRVLKTVKKGHKAYSLVEFVPQTGRTHQIRVHVAYIGNPIVGDSVYSRPNGQMFLHAKSLQLKLPSGELKRFAAKIPPRFTEFLK